MTLVFSSTISRVARSIASSIALAALIACGLETPPESGTRFDGIVLENDRLALEPPLTDELRRLSRSGLTLVGEAAHGTRELALLNVELVKLFVSEFGYRTIGLEVPGPFVEEMNRYCSGTGPQPAQWIEHLPWWHWCRNSGDELIHWLQQWNRDHPSRQVALVGIDNTFVSLETINGLLVEIGLAPIQERELNRFEEYWRNATPFARATVAVRENHLGRSNPALVSDLLAYLEAAEDVWEIAHSRGSLRMKRDLLMATRVMEAVEQRGELGGVLVFAHNDHIANEHYDASRLESAVGVISLDSGAGMGAHLRAVPGLKSSIIGTSLGRGEMSVVDVTLPVDCMVNGTTKVRLQLPTGSFDQHLSRRTSIPTLFSTSHAPDACLTSESPFCAWLPQLNTGGDYGGEDSAYVLRKSCEAFDAVLFFPEVVAGAAATNLWEE